MKKRYVQVKIDNEWVLIDADEYQEPEVESHMIVGDIPDYQSPVDGRIVSGRKQRREDLKRHGCVEYDPEIRKDSERIRKENDARFERQMSENVERTYYQMRDGMVPRETRIKASWLFDKKK